MTNYKITETQGINDLRDGNVISAKSLTHAKRLATKSQAFFNTWLHISDENGNHITRKNPVTGKWEDTQL